MYGLDQENEILYFQGRELRPYSVERNFVGFCSDCDGELSSLAYFKAADGWMVASRCQGCGRLILAEYDSGWSWEGDVHLEVRQPEKKEIKQPSKVETRASSISGLSREQLEAVFTSAELRDMERCERGEPYTRQNLYRARAKYEKFERLFGVRIDI